jgi:hypothetical protein
MLCIPFLERTLHKEIEQPFRIGRQVVIPQRLLVGLQRRLRPSERDKQPTNNDADPAKTLHGFHSVVMRANYFS